MAQLFSALFFSFLALGATLMVFAMLRAEWSRVAAILRGDELHHAGATVPQVRIKLRTWSRPEPRRPATQLRAAA